MTPTRWLIVLFWVVVIALLYREFKRVDAAKVQEGNAAPPHQYFFVPPPNAPKPAAPAPPPATGADVRQVKFVAEPNTPGMGSFTCLVTLQNVGPATARNVRVYVRPYRGAGYGSVDVGHVGYHVLKDTDPLSQYGAWVNFPDLKPGESSTQQAVFLDHPNVTPGYNSNPEIIFETAP
jgi:hypothetical protein